MNFDNYKNNLLIPKKEYEWTFFYRGKIMFKTQSQSEASNYQDLFPVYKKDRYWVNEEEYKKAQQAYQQEKVRIHIQFQEDLKKEFGIENNPKADMLFNKSWNIGHSEGISNVYSVYEDLVDLIR